MGKVLERLVKMGENAITRLQVQRAVMAGAATDAVREMEKKTAVIEAELARERRRTVELANERNALKIKVTALEGQSAAAASECAAAVAELAKVRLELETWKSAKAGSVAQQSGQGQAKRR